MNRFESKVVLITGGSSGIGLASARLFRAEGARVIVTGQDPDRLAAAQAELGSETLVLRSDAGSLADIEALMVQVQQRYGRLDVLFLNDAVIRAGSVDAVTVKDFDDTFGVNVRGTMFTVERALPLLGEGASIVVAMSIGNPVGVPNFATYWASQAALRAFIRAAASELIGRKIRVNAIGAGLIDTPSRARAGLPEAAAKVVLFLASEDSSSVVGVEIVVDGGSSLQRDA